MADAVIVTDRDGRVTFLNAVAESLTGWTQHNARGQSVTAICAMRNEQTREPVELPLAKVLHDGICIEVPDHTVLVARDAVEHRISGSASPIPDSNGTLLGAVLTLGGLDHRAFRLAEGDARNNAILETALDCIIAMDHHGNIVEFNPAAEKTFGYRRADAIGRELAELIIPPAQREAHRRGLTHFLATGAGPVLGKRIEVEGLRSDGSEFPVELAITCIRAGGPPQFTAYLRDISKRKRDDQLRTVRFAATQHLTQAADIGEAASGVLRSVCENLQWDLGFFWTVGEECDGLQCIGTWHDPAVAVTAFKEASRLRTFRRDEGLPGRVWSSGRATWILDLQHDLNFPRAAAAALHGLRSAFACPIVVGDHALGVIEFFTRRIREPDAELLETMTTVAGHVGQFMERRQAEEKLRTSDARAEQALRESESRFRGLMDQAPFSMQILSPEGRTIRVNRAWSDLWGITLNDLGDYNVLEDPQLEANGVLPHLRRAFAGEPAVLPPMEYDRNKTLLDVTRGEDAVRWVAAVAYPLKDDSGRVREVVLVHEDISTRRRAELAVRESEEKLRLLADTIPQLAWMAASDGHIFWYNRRWYEYTGTRHEDMEGWGWQSVHDPDVLPEVLERWRGSIARGEPFEMVFPLRGADHVFRPFLTRVNPLRDAEGRIVYWFGTNTDISEIKRMEEALRDADRRKDEFLATLAHELRNPLAPISNSLQILKMPRLDPAIAQQTRDMMERQIHHLVRLVDDLLDVSRVMRGKIELRREPVELATVVARAVETAQPLIDAHGHRLDIAIADESLLVDADPVRLAQVIGNLLTNAAKYTEHNGHIALSARRENGGAVLRLRDNGIGIASDMLPLIFDLFVQADPAATRSAGGLGVGLTLVRNLLAMHDGAVDVHSDGLGRGSEFTIRLPLLERPANELSALPQATPATMASRHRLLIVDDNKDAADSLAVLLRGHGHEVRVAYDGGSALDMAGSYRPALIFLDIGMPGMDGYEVARRLRQTPGLQNTVIAALTGWGQVEDRRRTASAGFDHHLVKPAETKALEDLLANVSKANG